MAAPYVSAAELKDAVGISDANDDPDIDRALAAASESIDDYCKRRFFRQGTDAVPVARYYTATSSGRLVVDDLVSVTSLKVDTNGDGTHNETWAAADFHLEPYNAEADNRPYTKIEAAGARRFHGQRRGVAVTGVFGWPAIPAVVQEACLLQASRWFKRGKDAPFGIAQIPQFEGNTGIRLLAKLDADVEVMLAGVRRHPVMVG